MMTERIHNWIQTIAAISVLFGLFLVFLELRQNQEFAQLQLGAEAFDNTYQRNLAIMGENYAEIELKACLSPEELTHEELIQHWAYLGTFWTAIRKTIRLELVADLGRPVEVIVRGSLREYLGYPLGMFDYQEFGERDWDELTRGIAADVIEKDEIVHCEDKYQPMLKLLKDN